MELMYITNNADIALIAEEAGVDRVWIDLETLGKEERQKGMNTVKSHHSIDDIKKIKPLLTKAKMQVRVNPWNPNSKDEIEQVIAAGAEYIMLPMWMNKKDVSNFLNAVNGRCKTILLLETKEAFESLDDVLQLKGIDEIHIGLNDLHLSYHLTFMFELMVNGIVDAIVEKIKKANIPFGIGGVSHLGDGMIPAEMVLLEHKRLGSTRAILSRGFCDLNSKDLDIIKKQYIQNMKEFREYESKLNSVTKEEIDANHEEFKRRVDMIVEAKKRG